jgi:hypothetical protein
MERGGEIITWDSKRSNSSIRSHRIKLVSQGSGMQVEVLNGKQGWDSWVGGGRSNRCDGGNSDRGDTGSLNHCDVDMVAATPSRRLAHMRIFLAPCRDWSGENSVWRSGDVRAS